MSYEMWICFVFQKRMSPKISRKIIDHGNTYKACNKNVDWMIMCIKNAVEFIQVKNWHFYEIKKRTKFTTNMYSDLRLEYRIAIVILKIDFLYRWEKHRVIYK